MGRRTGLAVAILLIAALAPAVCHGESFARDPELALPGGHVVEAGRWVELRWQRTDEIRELEILLSLDGGETYPVCISPQLDPDRCGFLWRVPDLRGRELRMRIRFNRGGREIEGPPTGPLFVAEGGTRPEPLGLPPVTNDGGERAPRSGGREAPAGRSGVNAGEADVAAPILLRTSGPAPAHARWPVHPESSVLGAPSPPPRFIPLRT